MRSLATIGMVLAVMFALAVPASATFIWEGSGDPTAAGNFTTVHGAGMSGTQGYTFDSPTAGFMQQDTTGYTGAGTYNRFVLSSTIAASQLSNAAGWTVETRVQTQVNSGSDAYAMFFDAEDNVGGIGILLHPTSIDVGPGDFSSSTTLALSDDGYHTIAINVAPGATSGHVWVDGVDSATVALAANFAAPTFTFGDASSSSVGQASWDYVKINAPEPCALVLLVMGVLGLICYAWRRRR
jgi:hypothetical protein